MRSTFKFLAFAALMQSFMPMIYAVAAEGVPTEKEIMAAEGAPPLIPHRVNDSDTARECLKCHETGKKGAPPTSHPERKACTQCHIPGEITAKRPAGKKR